MQQTTSQRAGHERRLTGYAGLAEYLGIPEGTLRSRVYHETIPHIRISERCVRFDLDAIDQWLASRSRPGQP
jgi:excisionase family DNA binding protein